MGQVTVVIPYTPRPQQQVIHTGMDTHRFGAAVCHRRFGKSVCAVNHLQRAALLCQLPRPRFGYIAPTYRQGKANVWDYMKHYARPIPGTEVNESELRITYPNTGQVRIYGADNPDSLRGLYFDGVVLDEYQLHPGNLYSEVIAPELADREGWALFLGTPNGKSAFYKKVQQAKANPDWFHAEFKASDTGILSEAELAIHRAEQTEDEYQQEFECSFEAAVKGAVYTRELKLAREEGRITRVPHDPVLKVETDWDLGYDDYMAIWFVQRSPGGEVRLINYYQNRGFGFPHYAKVLDDYAKQFRYLYGDHWAPHDIAVHEIGLGNSRWESARQLGIHFQVVARIQTGEQGEVDEGIDNARRLLPKCWFDAEKCAVGLEALQHYHFDFNSRIDDHTGKPVHDQWSHAADAFRGLATRYYKPQKVKREEPEPLSDSWYDKVRKANPRRRNNIGGRGGYGR